MAKASGMIYVTVGLTNPKAIRALMAIKRMAEELADDQPWNDMARKIGKAAAFLIKNTEIDIEAK